MLQRDPVLKRVSRTVPVQLVTGESIELPGDAFPELLRLARKMSRGGVPRHHEQPTDVRQPRPRATPAAQRNSSAGTAASARPGRRYLHSISVQWRSKRSPAGGRKPKA